MANNALVENIILPLGDLVPDLVGIVVPISHLEEVDICSIMSDLLDEFDFAPTHIIDEIDVELAVTSLPDIRGYRFNLAIPLRRCENWRNCLRWNQHNHKWEIITFSKHVRVVGENLMIIARRKS